MKKFNFFSLIIFIFLFTVLSCVKEEWDFENLSKQINLTPQIFTPAVKGSLTVKDLFEDLTEDSVIVFLGDTVILYLKQDSVVNFNVDDLIDISYQGTKSYSLNSGPTDFVFPSNMTYELTDIKEFVMELENGLRPDSMITYNATLDLEIISNFPAKAYLELSSNNILTKNGIFDTIIPLSRPSGNYYKLIHIPLRGTKVIFDNSTPGITKIFFNIKVFISGNSGEVIPANSYVNLNIGIDALKPYEKLFGYVGVWNINKDTIVDTELDEIKGLSGSFAVTNPKINIHYKNTFGFPITVDAKIKGYFENNDSVILDPPAQNLLYSTNYLIPEKTGSLKFSRNNIPNIDQFLVFPPVKRVGLAASLETNKFGNSNELQWVLNDSKIIGDLEIEIPLEFRSNLVFIDTFEFETDIDEENKDIVEWLNINYKIKNEFPLNLEVSLILFDSVSMKNIDTLNLNDFENNTFLKAAPVDANGITIFSQVKEYKGRISLDKNEMNNLLFNTNKIILKAKILSTDFDKGKSVKILNSYKLDFKFYIDAKINYKENLK